MLSSENTSKQLIESNIDTAIVSFGATEQFGPFLPMDIDNYEYQVDSAIALQTNVCLVK